MTTDVVSRHPNLGNPRQLKILALIPLNLKYLHYQKIIKMEDKQSKSKSDFTYLYYTSFKLNKEM